MQFVMQLQESVCYKSKSAYIIPFTTKKDANLDKPCVFNMVKCMHNTGIRNYGLHCK